MIWQNCRACDCWHPIGAAHLSKQELAKLSGNGETAWIDGQPYVNFAECNEDMRASMIRDIEARFLELRAR